MNPDPIKGHKSVRIQADAGLYWGQIGYRNRFFEAS
jgi:hypothetical protein